jgi:hypothetical protein
VGILPDPHHEGAAADSDGHVAVHHEGDPAEHLHFRQAGVRTDTGADVGAERFVVCHGDPMLRRSVGGQHGEVLRLSQPMCPASCSDADGLIRATGSAR